MTNQDEAFSQAAIIRSALRYPDFLCIGAQKAGTTWLNDNLRWHPQIWLPPVKELQYFNDLYIEAHRTWTGKHREKHGSLALNQYLSKTPPERWDYKRIAVTANIVAGPISDYWYGSIFAAAGDGQICGEVTPEYSLLGRDGVRHVLKLAPDIKIMFFMRDPIDRAWSHIRMIAPANAGVGDLLRVAAFKDVASRADYAAILKLWSEFVAADRLLTVFMDEIAATPSEVMQRICAFLGINFDMKFFPRLATPVHVGGKLDMPPEIHAFLKAQLNPVYASLRGLFPEQTAKWMALHY